MTKSLQEYMKRIQFFTYMSTWVCENRVGKQFVISLNFSCLIFFTVLFSYVDFFSLVASWLGICVEKAVGGIFDSPLPPSLKGVFPSAGAVTYCPASDKGF